MTPQSLRSARRIAVIGSPGAGKSTLSRTLAERLGLPLVHLDQLHWGAGWSEPPDDVWQQRMASAAAAEHWVIDGNYAGTLNLRLARADVVLWLDPPTALCLWRIVKRIAAGHGRTRSDMAPGCPERWDWTFLAYVARFRRQSRPRLVAALSGYAGPVFHIKRRDDVAALLRAL